MLKTILAVITGTVETQSGCIVFVGCYLVVTRAVCRLIVGIRRGAGLVLLRLCMGLQQKLSTLHFRPQGPCSAIHSYVSRFVEISACKAALTTSSATVKINFRSREVPQCQSFEGEMS